MADAIASIKNLPYDETINYSELVVDFAKRHKFFIDNPEYDVDTLRTVAHIQKGNNFPGVDKNRFWHYWYKGQLLIQARIDYNKRLIASLIDAPRTEYMFITIGFDDKTDIDYPKMQRFADKVCHLNADKFVKKADFVLEKHRATHNGEIYIHHHAHFLIIVDEHLRKSKIIELVYKIANIKRYVKGKEFIDIKTPNATEFSKRAQPYSVLYNYVKGVKATEKSECLARDKAWREGYDTHEHYPSYEKHQL